MYRLLECSGTTRLFYERVFAAIYDNGITFGMRLFHSIL